MKAMAEQVHDRYATAQQMEADLQRFLEDEPVLARPAGIAARCRRMVLHHAKWSLWLLLLFFACGAILTISVLVVAHERDQARVALVRTNELRQNADRQRQAAERDRQQAQANFELAHDAVERIFLTAAYELEELPVGTAVRVSLLEAVLEYYQEFLQQQSTNKTVRFDLAVALSHVSRIQHQLGNDDESEQAIAQACQVLRQLVMDHPDQPDYRAKLAEFLIDKSHICLERLGCCQLTTSLESSLRSVSDAVTLLEQLLDEQPEDVRRLSQLAAAYVADGDVLTELHRVDEAERQYRRGTRPLESSAATTPRLRRKRWPDRALLITGRAPWSRRKDDCRMLNPSISLRWICGSN